jgi:cytohesin
MGAIERGDAMNATTKHMGEALQLAAAEGDRGFVDALLAKGAGVDDRGTGGVTPLHRAAESNHVELVRFLLAKGADVGARTDGGWTPLHAAAAAGATDVVRALLGHGADVDATDARGETALDVAVQWRRAESAALLTWWDAA